MLRRFVWKRRSYLTRMTRFPAYLDDSGESKVAHLAGVVLPHQHVPRCQIPVDALLLFQVGHPISYLGPHVNERGDVLNLPFWT